MVTAVEREATGLEQILNNLPNLSPVEKSLIERAYRRAEQAHRGQVRKSGEPYFTHCVAVAQILSDLKLDASAIAAALLHDTVEDTSITLENIEQEFGLEVARLVDGVTKMDQLPTQVDSRARDREAEYLRKTFLAMNDDVRIVLIKLADRLHNMRTLGYLSPVRQIEVAHETMDIFAPLANRLGIWQMKWELEDLSFRYTNTAKYREIAAKIDERRADRDKDVARLTQILRDELKAHGIKADVSGRPKHIFSIYRKMQGKGVPFEQVYDVRALRVLVEDMANCYQALGVVHALWRPLPGEFDDYIAAPKDNFYQSLHTTVYDDQGKALEVQIRTWEMHYNAEYGIAAHWRYKEGNKRESEAFERRITYLRQLMAFKDEVQDDQDAAEFMASLKSEVFQDRVYVFTPKGDIIDLPAGATPVDFAYYIHTEIGNRCRGARVNGKLVGLDYELKTGDRCEILTAKRGGPSLDWLNVHLGYTATTRARAKIRAWFRKQNRENNIAAGREALERELKRLGLESMSYESIASLFNYSRTDDFLARIGSGDINSVQIATRLLEAERQAVRESESLLPPPDSKTERALPRDASDGIEILGTGGLLVNLARCCNPTPGDDIIGYITRGRGVTVHRTDCKNVLNTDELDRLISVNWGRPSEKTYPVPVVIIAYDREGLMRDIGAVIADEKISMSNVSITTRQSIATFLVMMEINDINQLTRVLNRIERLPNVVEAHRRTAM